MSEKLGAVLGVGIIAGIGVLVYTIIKEKPIIETKTILPIFDYDKAYNDALKKIQETHLVNENVKNTLRDVADSIPKIPLNLKGVVTVTNEIRDIVTVQLSKLGGGGGSDKPLFM